MNNEGEGGPEGGVSVGEDREVGLRVALTKEEKQKWKNRLKIYIPFDKNLEMSKSSKL